MRKCIEINGTHYRVRRGKLVAIPPEWLGKVPTSQEIRSRQRTKRDFGYMRGRAPGRIDRETREAVPGRSRYRRRFKIQPATRHGRQNEREAAIRDYDDD